MKITTDTVSSLFSLNTAGGLVFATAVADRASFFAAYSPSLSSTWTSLSNTAQQQYFTLNGTFSFSDASALQGASGTVSSFIYLEYKGRGVGYDRVLFDDLSLDFNALLFNTEWAALLAGNDEISGGPIADTLAGYSGDDLLTGGAGSDTLQGGDGQDTAIFSGPRANYSISDRNGVVTISDGAGNDGIDTLTGIELLRFSDMEITLAQIDETAPPVIRTVTQSLSLIVDGGVLGADPLILNNLLETVVYSNDTVSQHSIRYNGQEFDYAAVDPLLMTLVRDGEFTAEFQAEIAAYAPAYGDITYQQAVSLVGVADLNGVMITVAGADGNYVG